MANNQTRSFNFTAETQGLTDAFDRVRRAGSGMYRDLLNESTRYSSSTRVQQQYLQEREREIRGNARSTYNEDISSAREIRQSNYAELEAEITTRRKTQSSGAIDRYRTEQEAVIESRYAEDTVNARDARTNTLREASGINELVRANQEAARAIIVAAKQGSTSIESKLLDLESSDDENARFLAGILREELSRNGVQDGLSEQDRDYINRTGSNPPSEEPSKIASILSDLATSKRLTAITSAAQGMIRSQDGSEILRSAVDITANAGGLLGQSLGGMLPGFGKMLAPFIGEAVEGGIKIIGEAGMRTYEERNKLERNIFSYSALTGSPLDSKTYQAKIEQEANGYSDAEVKSYQFEKLRKQGTFDVDLEAESKNPTALGTVKLGANMAIDKVKDGLGMETFQDVVVESANQKAMRQEMAYKKLSEMAPTYDELSSAGISYSQFQQEQMQAVKARGSKSNAVSDTKTAIFAEKGLGIDKGITYQLIELQRNSGKEISNTIGGILRGGQGQFFKDGDRTFLPEFLQKFTQFQKSLLQSNVRVSDGGAFNTISMFDKLGGSFKANDTRSMGNIENINNSLKNPGNELLDMLNLSAIRENNPNADPFEIFKKRKEGLGDPSTFKSMLKNIKSLNVSDSEQKLAIMKAFGLQERPEDAETLFNGSDELINSKAQEFSQGKYGKKFLQNEADKYTTLSDKNSAEIQNSFVRGATDGMIQIGRSMVEVIKTAFAGATIQMRNGQMVLDRSEGALPAQPKKPGNK